MKYFDLVVIVLSVFFLLIVYTQSEEINFVDIEGAVAVVFGGRNVLAYFSKRPMLWWYGMSGDYDHLKQSTSFQKGVCASSFSIAIIGVLAIYYV